MRKRLATIKSRFWRAAHYFARRHDATWPFTDTPEAPDKTFTTDANTPANISIGVNPNRVIYVDAKPIWTGHPGVAVDHGSVTWVTPNLVFTPTTDYTGSVAFSYTISDGKRRNTGNVTGTVS